MDFTIPKSRVYVKVDDQNRIIRCEGEYTLSNISDIEEWVLIEEGDACDRLNLAQSQYFVGGLYTNDGIPRWELADNEDGYALRSDEAIEADREIAQRPAQIAELKAQLAATDYKAIKFAEGWLSEEEYAPVRAERQALRELINELEG